MRKHLTHEVYEILFRSTDLSPVESPATEQLEKESPLSQGKGRRGNSNLHFLSRPEKEARGEESSCHQHI